MTTTATTDQDQVTRHAQTILDALRDETAYAGDPHAWIGLASLRETAALTRTDFDTALTHLSRTNNRISIVPESNQKSLTPADREAAIWLGGQWKHLVSETR